MGYIDINLPKDSKFLITGAAGPQKLICIT